MSGIRAKDADRDRFVELIEAAYVDGQLSSEDRDLRVTRALSAATVDELEALTRDLQGRPAPDVVPPVPTHSPTQPRRLVGVLVALVAGVVLLGVGAASLVVFTSPDAEPGIQTGIEVVEQSSPAVPEPVAEEPEVASFEMKPAQVREFLRLYEAEFGTLDTYQAAFYPTRVSVEVPVRGSRPRFERWSYDGTWRRDAEAAGIGPFYDIVDLGSVNVDQLFANIDVARRTLDVQRGELTHVVVHRLLDDDPTVNIYIGNKFRESGYLMTTFGGEVVRRFPYES